MECVTTCETQPGSLVHPNGQRLMIIPFSELKNWRVQIPEWQRFLDYDRVEELFYCIRQQMKDPVQTTIVLAELQDRFYLIDGQHRYMAYEKLYLQYRRDINVIVNIVPVESEKEIFEVCRTINNSRPFELPDDPNTFLVAKNITEILHHKYYPYFVSSANPRRPNVNADRFSQCLAKLLLRGSSAKDGAADPSQIYEKLEDLNSKYEFAFRDPGSAAYHDHLAHFMCPGDTTQKIAKFIKVIQKKAVTHKFFLGLFKNYDWALGLSGGEGGSKPSIKNTPDPGAVARLRTAFSKSDRRLIWNAKQGKHRISGNCSACARILDVDTFQVGHIRAVANGGNNDMDNLDILCVHCNLKMGTQNLMEYKNLISKSHLKNSQFFEGI